MNKSKLPTFSVDNSVNCDVVIPQRPIFIGPQQGDHFSTKPDNLLIYTKLFIYKLWHNIETHVR